jgi:hypothetical protein
MCRDLQSKVKDPTGSARQAVLTSLICLLLMVRSKGLHMLTAASMGVSWPCTQPDSKGQSMCNRSAHYTPERLQLP